jgi:hypothetical protein
MLPGLSATNADPARFVRGLQTAFQFQGIVVMVPVAVLLAAGPVLVPWYLGPGWGLAASLLPLLAVGYGLAFMTLIPAVAAEASGDLMPKLLIQLVTLVVIVVLSFWAVVSGPTAMNLTLAWVVGEAVRHLLYVLVVMPRIGLDPARYWFAYAQAFVTAVAIGGPIWVVVRVSSSPTVLGLTGGGLAGLLLVCVLLVSPLGTRTRRESYELFVRIRE